MRGSVPKQIQPIRTQPLRVRRKNSLSNQLLWYGDSSFIYLSSNSRAYTYIDMLHVYVKHSWKSFGSVSYRSPRPHIILRSAERNPSFDRKLLSDHACLLLLHYRFRSRESPSSLWVSDRVRNPARCNISFMCKGAKVESLSCLAGIRITCIRKNNVIFHGYKQRL